MNTEGMQLVRCKSTREEFPEQIQVGKKYWLCTKSVYKDCDQTEYGSYFDIGQTRRIGTLRTDHFEIVYPTGRYEGLYPYINTHVGIILKTILDWCEEQQRLSGGCNSLAKNLLKYIKDNKLNTEENMYKDFVINSIPYKEFVKRDMAEKYQEYMGYNLYCIE